MSKTSAIRDEQLPEFLQGELNFHKHAANIKITLNNLSTLRVPKKSKENSEFVFKDLNPREREIQSREILTSGEVLKRPSRRAYSAGKVAIIGSFERDVANSFIHMSRHTSSKTPFLTLTSSTVTVSKVDPKEILKTEIQKAVHAVKNKESATQVFSIDLSPNDFNILPSNSSPKMRPQSPLRVATQICSGTAASLKAYQDNWKRDIAQKLKEGRNNQSRAKMDNVAEAKKKNKVMRKVAEFRRDILTRLEEMRTPETASIMRLLTDEMIFNFIDSHKGQSLTVDAIIASMVAPKDAIAVDGDVETVDPGQIYLKNKQANYPGGFRVVPNKASTTYPHFHPHGSLSPSSNMNNTLRIERTSDKTLEVHSESLPLLSPYSQSMLAVHNQMVIEGSLPSLQPERALTDEQLMKMGSEKNGVSKVLNDILRERRWEARRAQQKGHTNIELFVPGSPKMKAEKIAPLAGKKAPRALKTREFDPKGLPKSPYKDGNEMGKIIAYGIPSGAGLPIHKKYYDRSANVELDRNGQPVTPTTKKTESKDVDEIDESSLLEYMMTMNNLT